MSGRPEDKYNKRPVYCKDCRTNIGFVVENQAEANYNHVTRIVCHCGCKTIPVKTRCKTYFVSDNDNIYISNITTKVSGEFPNDITKESEVILSNV
jgi:hypothetical protein